MYKSNLLFSLIMSLVVSVLICGSALADEWEVREFEMEPGGQITINCKAGGSISIEGWDRNLVRITCDDRSNDYDDWKFDMKKSGNELDISARLKNRRIQSNSLSFEIMVPRKIDVEFESGGGSFVAEGVEGNFEGRTAGGRLILNEVKGRVYLSTGGSEIKVTNCEVDGRMTTGGGEVLVKNVVGNLKASSGGGNVRYINVRDRDGDMRNLVNSDIDGITDETVMITNAGGAINIRNAPQGAVLSTGGGNINVRRAGKFVEASTGGGDINVELEDGWAHLRTGAGDIEVEIGKDTVGGDEETVIVSGYGDIWLEVPKGFGMDLEIEIGYTRSSRQNFKIVSDLDIDEEHSRKWDHSFSSNPKKFIYGTGKFGNGDHQISIRTTNGDVHLVEK
jgi:hypothetical protein